MKKHLSVFLILSAAAASQAYTVQLVSQSVTTQAPTFLLTSSNLPYMSEDGDCVFGGISASGVVQGNDILLDFSLSAGATNVSWPAWPEFESGSFVNNGSVVWKVKSKFEFIPSYPGETPGLANYTVFYDKWIKYRSLAYVGAVYLSYPQETGLSSSAYALLNSTMYSGTSASTSATFNWQSVQEFVSDEDGDNSTWLDAGDYWYGSVFFTLVNGKWIGESTSYFSQADTCMGSANFTIFPGGIWDTSSSVQVGYKLKPVQVGVYTLP